MDEITTVQENRRFIGISMGEEQFGIDIQNIDNILRMQHITRVPMVPEYIKGVINLRGEVIPVMSLRIKMGIGDDVETDKTRIIINKVDQHGTIGFIVDEVKEVLSISDDQIEKVVYDNKDEQSSYIFGVGKVNGTLISLLDLSLVLTERE